MHTGVTIRERASPHKRERERERERGGGLRALPQFLARFVSVLATYEQDSYAHVFFLNCPQNVPTKTATPWTSPRVRVARFAAHNIPLYPSILIHQIACVR